MVNHKLDGAGAPSGDELPMSGRNSADVPGATRQRNLQLQNLQLQMLDAYSPEPMENHKLDAYSTNHLSRDGLPMSSETLPMCLARPTRHAGLVVNRGRTTAAKTTTRARIEVR